MTIALGQNHLTFVRSFWRSGKQQAMTQYAKQYAKHLLVRTQFESLVQQAEWLLGVPQRIKHPELHEIYHESLRIEQVMQRIIRESFNCIDIGCHLGYMLSTFAKLAPQGHHMAFEPVPLLAGWLKRKFPEVDVRQLALSDTSGEVTFYHNTKRTGFSGLRRHMPGNDTIEEISVQCERLDNILPPDYRVDFIKVDVEGAELAVLRGAFQVLRRDRPPILFECTNSGLSCFDFTSEQIFEFLTQHSYSVFLFKDFLDNGKPLDFEQFHDAMQYPFKAFNFIAVAN